MFQERADVFKERSIQFGILGIAHHTLDNLKLRHLFNDLINLIHRRRGLEKLIIITGKNRHRLDQIAQEQAEGSHSNVPPEGKRGKNAHPQHEQRKADNGESRQK